MRFVFGLLTALLFSSATLTAQISDTISPVDVFGFSIRSHHEVRADKNFLFLSITRHSQQVLIDSVMTDKDHCSGFAIPAAQPFKEYFLFSKHERGNGKTYILSFAGECNVIYGGTFWAAPKDKLLFILAERDLTNLVVYSLRDKKVLLEKFNCDEFDGWYYRHHAYMGSVTMECGLEPEKEKEVSEWMYPVEVEKYVPADNSLFEAHTNQGELEKAKKLARYASCR